MKYCPKCNIDYTGVELENEKVCPSCTGQLGEIKSQKLIDLMSEVMHAVSSTSSDTIKTNPKQLIEIAKIIERGEKRFNKEFEKRLDQMREIKFELLAIENFCRKMGYAV